LKNTAIKLTDQKRICFCFALGSCWDFCDEEARSGKGEAVLSPLAWAVQDNPAACEKLSHICRIRLVLRPAKQKQKIINKER
jgi:hypothetical protein